MIYFPVKPFKIKIILAIFKKIFKQISCRCVKKFWINNFYLIFL